MRLTAVDGAADLLCCRPIFLDSSDLNVDLFLEIIKRFAKTGSCADLEETADLASVVSGEDLLRKRFLAKDQIALETRAAA